MNILFSIAHAQDSGQGQQPSLAYNLLLFGGMFFLFWLILWRPQAKRAKEHRNLVDSISKGDEVMTSGGLLGKVTKVNEEYIAVEISDGVQIKLQKSSVAAALPKGTISQI